MRLAPHPGTAGAVDDEPATAVWHHHQRDLTMVAVWSAKRAGLGEDAEPTFLHYAPDRHGLIGVYDGLGGAGARHAGAAPDGRQISHAFVASRLAYLTTQAWFADHVGGGSEQSLRDRLATVLASARSSGRAKLVGTLRRDFPTTLALMEYRGARAGVDITAYWAGDSRCYLLTPEEGLQQLSRDDSDIHDPLQLLIADQPMTNLVSAAGDFEINIHPIGRVPYPCVLVCATDGFFGYVAAPALFEHVVLDELRSSRDQQQWAGNLARRVVSYTADDASLVLVALGFGSYQKLQASFRRRVQKLDELHHVPLQNIGSREELVERRQRSWDLYRDLYMRYVDGRNRPEGHG